MGVEQHFLIVHCRKYDTFHPIPLTSPAEVDIKRMNKIEPDFPCFIHNSDRDRMGEKYHFVAHGSESVLITIKNTDWIVKDASSEAVDKAVVIYEKYARKKAKKEAKSVMRKVRKSKK